MGQGCDRASLVVSSQVKVLLRDQPSTHFSWHKTQRRSMKPKIYPDQAYIHLDLENQNWINARTAWILQEFGIGLIRSCAITLPDSPLFNEYGDDSHEEVCQFFEHVAKGMGIDPLRIDFALVSEMRLDDGTQALGTYQAVDDRFIICVDDSQLGKPYEMLATMVHELCHVHLMGYGRLSGAEPDNEPLTDLLTVYLGYGIILANSVVYDETLRVGHFYESQMGRRGYLTMPMFGYALALLAKLRGEDGSEWKRHMRLDVRDAFVKTLRFLDRNGMPDLSTAPTDFSAPRIVLESNDDPIPDPHRKLPFYPEDYQPEVPAELTDFAIPLEPALAEDDTECTCIYCCAPVDGDRDELICQACQRSIDEGEQEINEERARDERYERLQSRVLIGCLLIVAVAFCLMILLSNIG